MCVFVRLVWFGWHPSNFHQRKSLIEYDEEEVPRHTPTGQTPGFTFWHTVGSLAMQSKYLLGALHEELARA